MILTEYLGCVQLYCDTYFNGEFSLFRPACLSDAVIERRYTTTAAACNTHAACTSCVLELHWLRTAALAVSRIRSQERCSDFASPLPHPWLASCSSRDVSKWWQCVALQLPSHLCRHRSAFSAAFVQRSQVVFGLRQLCHPHCEPPRRLRQYLPMQLAGAFLAL
jgi:hypothetical protein